ncbi:MAG: AAA family ATPase [Hungatella hathewayi]|nr:AAA family ATPase [Hungatella hathewayi]
MKTTLKGNQSLSQVLVTGIQRLTKESIFSQLNNPKVYTL